MMTGRMAGQTINDRFLAAKHSIAGQGLAKSVCKATTEEMIGPKKKHLDYLVHCTNEPNVSIPQMANLLIERSQNSNWVVVYKALVTVHHIMCYGNERFTQYLASSNCTFQLSNFFDKSGVQGVLAARTGYDMSPFIRRYSRYLNEKALSYRTVAFDFCKVKRGKEDGMLRTMNAEKLLKTLPCLQSQLDALLEFDCSANDLSNGVINMCFMLLFRDLIRLFACYNDGIINLLEKFFDMNKKQCREGLDIYKKFLIRMDRVAEFLRVAENVGIDKGDIPDLTKAPSSLLDALEQHLNAIDGKKSSTSSTPSQSSSNQKSLTSAMSALSSTSNAFGTAVAVANGRMDSHTNGIDERVKQQILAEEEAAMNQFKSKVPSPTSANNNPFLNAVNSHPMPGMDLLDNEAVSSNATIKASDDLLQLGNPFVDAFAMPQPAAQMPQANNVWLPNGTGYPKPQKQQQQQQQHHHHQQQQPVITNGTFVSESNFASVFGASETKTAEESFNPFLKDDPTPSLLLDDSTNPDNKPIKDVLEYFQKDNSLQFSNGADEVSAETETKSIASDSKIDLTSGADESVVKIEKRPVPPPRPPPPKRASSINALEITNECLDDDNKIVTLEKSDSFPSVFNENDGVPVLMRNTTINTQSAFDGLGGVLQPSTQSGHQNQPSTPNNNTNNIQQQQQSGGALITGDLESSLASLAENLSIRAPQVKGVQWNSPKNGSKTGSSWTPQPLAATTGAGYKPMNQSMASPQPMMQPQMFPQMQPVMGIRPIVTNNMFPQRTGMVVGGATAATASLNPMGQQQSLLFN